MGKKLSWKKLSSFQKNGIIILAVIELILLVAALTDIARRPAGKIKGRKLWWVLISFIEFLGPVAYFGIGRKNSEDIGC